MANILDITRELRDKIYRYCFVLEDHLEVCFERYMFDIYPSRIGHVDASANLLSTCSQFYQEGVPILYGLNSFDFPDNEAMKYLSDAVGAYPSSCIKAISTKFPFDAEIQNVTFYTPFTGLKRLHFGATIYFPRQNLVPKQKLEERREDNEKWHKGHAVPPLSTGLKDWLVKKPDIEIYSEVVLRGLWIRRNFQDKPGFDKLRTETYRLILDHTNSGTETTTSRCELLHLKSESHREGF